MIDCFSARLANLKQSGLLPVTFWGELLRFPGLSCNRGGGWRQYWEFWCFQDVPRPEAAFP